MKGRLTQACELGLPSVSPHPCPVMTRLDSGLVVPSIHGQASFLIVATRSPMATQPIVAAWNHRAAWAPSGECPPGAAIQENRGHTS